MNSTFKTDVGEIEFEGNLFGNSDISSKLGAVKIELSGDKKDYYIDVDNELGSVEIDNEENNSFGDTSAKNHINIDSELGSVEVDF